MFNWNDFINDFPYTNFSDINVSWFLNKFKQIFDEWQGLYTSLQEWKTATDSYNEQWRQQQETAFQNWENNFQSAIDNWKTQTENDINTWESNTLVNLEAWKTTFITEYNTLKAQVEQIAVDAENAKNSAQASAQSAQQSAENASAAALALQTSLQQIDTNTNDISDLKESLMNESGVIPGEYIDALNDNILKYHISKNIFNPHGVHVPGRLMSDYTVQETGYTGTSTSDFIPIKSPSNIIGTRITQGTARDLQRITAIATYDANKNPLTYRLNNAAQYDYFEIAEGTAYIRISVTDTYFYTGAETYKPMIYYGDTVSQDYEAYYTPYYEVIKTYPHCTEDIVCWGDSLTYGTGSTSGHTYPEDLAQKTGKTVYRRGFPGDNSAEIAGYQGAIPLVVAPVTIPASGSVNVDLYDYTRDETTVPLKFPNFTLDFLNPVTIGGVEGNLSISTTQPNYTDRTYTFTRTESGNKIHLYGYTPVITKCSKERRKDIAVIWVGTNGGWANDPDVLVKQVETMIKFQDVAVNKYIVLGLATGLQPTVAKNVEDVMLLAFGNHFVNVREYLIYYGLTENGITPTTEDTQRISEGKVPTSLITSDLTHLNDYGYNSVANAVYKQGKILGYWN